MSRRGKCARGPIFRRPWTILIFASGLTFAGDIGPADYYNRHVENRFVKENAFIGKVYKPQPLPRFEDIRDLLPQPFWESHADAVDCYWKAWEIAFGNLRQPSKNSRFTANYIDTAFNDHIFMWDSVFMLLFGLYGSRAFPFLQTLDNFYASQHSDGYICREIRESDGAERFERFDPSSTGPNLFPWVEWEYYQNFGDKDRLASVFPVLAAYTQWFKKYRTWPDGTYFASGWGTGMDNQPRVPEGYSPEFDHGHMSWIDRTLQEIFIDRIMLEMAKTLGRASEIADLEEEAGRLKEWVNEKMWNDKIAFYADRFRDGTVSDVKSIGAYWALMAGAVPPDRLARFCRHLADPAEFDRRHRIPSLSADTPGFEADGGYWLGGVWPLTNYIVLRGLTRCGYDSLAHAIALNHLRNVVAVFKRTGTLWENYAPDLDQLPRNSRKDFVGFTGLSPISILFEYIFGIRPDARNNRIGWDIRLTEKHGILRYPFGEKGWVQLTCEHRGSQSEEPVIRVISDIPLTLIVKWQGGSKTVSVRPE
jgi:hypothetical protein